MVTSIKVKDNSNLAPLLIVFGIFPLVIIFIIFNFNLGYVISILIALALLIIFLVFFFKYLLSKQDEYAIVANEEEITFLKSGTFKWEEITTIKAIDENSIFTRRPQYLIAVSLKNGKKFKVDVTNFDYQVEELALILRSLGKLSD